MTTSERRYFALGDSDPNTGPKGDVVLVDIEFTDRSGAKVRPTVVLSTLAYNRGGRDVIIVPITSNLNVTPLIGDSWIVSWQRTGLLVPGIVQAKPATLDEGFIVRKVGALLPADLPNGDAYILRQIIHDWDDTRATKILANCRRSIATQGRLLVVERAIAPDYHQSLPVLHIDLEMLVLVGGLQRTDEEYSVLFAGAGFRLTKVVPLADAAQFCVFEGVPV